MYLFLTQPPSSKKILNKTTTLFWTTPATSHTSPPLTSLTPTSNSTSNRSLVRNSRQIALVYQLQLSQKVVLTTSAFKMKSMASPKPTTMISFLITHASLATSRRNAKKKSTVFHPINNHSIMFSTLVKRRKERLSKVRVVMMRPRISLRITLRLFLRSFWKTRNLSINFIGR